MKYKWQVMDGILGPHTMDVLASQGKEFFFMVDAWADHWVVIESFRMNKYGIKWSLDGVGNAPPVQSAKQKVSLQVLPVCYKCYSQGFQVIRRHQLRGETWLANLTFPSMVKTNASLQEVFNSAQAKFRLLVPDTMVVFSPERFIHIRSDGKISAYPMKGTIRADVPDAERKILANSKETAEHNTIVDLLRNDLSMVAHNVTVSDFRFITQLFTGGTDILQVSSEITGTLDSNWKNRVGEIMASLLPAGSVTGAPKKRTEEIIREAENHERGWYSGVFGYFNGWELDSAVSIRFIEQDSRGNMVFHSGGGITINSDVNSEYSELMDKIYVPSY